MGATTLTAPLVPLPAEPSTELTWTKTEYSPSPSAGTDPVVGGVEVAVRVVVDHVELELGRRRGAVDRGAAGHLQLDGANVSS